MIEPPQGPCIVVIDDDESVRDSIVSLIESVGYEVAFFGSAEEFLSSPKFDQANCLIVDVRLPGISGLQLYSRIKTTARKIHTIFITAHVDEPARASAMRNGAVAFLYKPFQSEALLGALRTAVGEARP
jgi:two-component system, LuxR family, response regulator FixJ